MKRSRHSELNTRLRRLAASKACQQPWSANKATDKYMPSTSLSYRKASNIAGRSTTASNHHNGPNSTQEFAAVRLVQLL